MMTRLHSSKSLLHHVSHILVVNRPENKYSLKNADAMLVNTRDNDKMSYGDVH